MMIKVSFLFFISLLVSFSFSSLISLENDATPGIPYDWHIDDFAPNNGQIELLIAMKIENKDSLEKYLLSVSQPSSLDYGKYWTKTQVNNYFKPSNDKFEQIFLWLQTNGINSYNIIANRFIKVYTTVEKAEKLLSVDYYTVIHDRTNYKTYKALNHYKVPQQIADIIQIIGGVIRFPKIPPSLEKKIPILGSTTPEVIQSMYNITIPSPANGNLQAVASFLGQYYSPSDLSDFESAFSLPQTSIANTIGTNDPTNPGIEASLDVQYLLGVSNCSTPTWVISTANETPSGNEPFLTFLSSLDSLDQIPYLISMSYQDYEYTVSEDYANLCNQEFMAYALQGITFTTGSGDWGVGCPEFGQCNTFTADFPSSSPYVISTGATTFDNNGNEMGVSFSSGGFSNYFARPSFQDNVINTFLNQPNLPPSSYYNSSGRGFPDISAIGTGYVVYVNSKHTPVGGTSASTPCFGSMLSMINSMRLSAGKPVLGYALPFIYQAYATNNNAFNDITTAQVQDEGCCGARFQTTPGWDPYTGLGTPNFYILSQLAMDSTLFPSFK